MFVIATTRFNKNTWNENFKWREKNKCEGCVYGSPFEMAKDIILDSNVFMIEMHNDENKIKGIGFLKNTIRKNKYYNIYTDKNYNRFTYLGDYRVDIDEMSRKEVFYMEILERLIFKTSHHLKRGCGITRLPERILKNKFINFINVFKNMFLRKYLMNISEITIKNKEIYSENKKRIKLKLKNEIKNVL